MQKSKRHIFGLIFAAVIHSSFCNYAMNSQETAEKAFEIANIAISENLRIFFGVGSCVGLIANLYDVNKELKSYICPSDEERAYELEIAKKIKLLELRKKLRTCLVDKRKNIERGVLGIPCECEEAAIELTLFGGHVDADKMIAIFNLFNK